MIAPKDDNTEGVSIKDTDMVLPRIHESLILNLGDFVTHDYCQQLVRKAFFEDSFLKKKPGMAFFFLVVFQLLIATPIGWILNFLSKLNILATSKKSKNGKENNSNIPVCLNMDVPVNMLVSHALVQITFVVVILIELVNADDIMCELDFDVIEGNFDVFNALCLAMAFAQLLSILEEMFQQTRVIEGNLFEGFKRFFSTYYHNYRLLGLILFITGAIMRGVGYKSDTKFICLEVNSTSYHLIDDDYSRYKGGMVEVGTCLQGLSVIIILSQLLQFLRLHPSVSAIYVGMLKCIWHVFSYGVTYIILTLTFSAGIYFLLPNTETQCDNIGLSLARAKQVHDSCIIPHINNNISLSYFKANCSAKTDNSSTLFRTYPGAEDDDKKTSIDKNCANHTLLFTSYHDTTTYLFLEFFSPMSSVYQEFECKCGISRDVGLAICYIYYFLVCTVLVNLLIALMNSTISDIESFNAWIYNRTLLWMRFCRVNAVVLPPPMNLIHYILTLFCHPKYEESLNEKEEKENKYKSLIEELVTRYIHDKDTFDGNEVAMKEKLEYLERLVGEMNVKINMMHEQSKHK